MSTHDVITPSATVGAAPQAPAVAVWAEVAVKVYGSGDAAVRALDDVSVAMPAGRFTAVIGPSGSGKSTHMHCMAGLDDLTSGRSFVGNVDLGSVPDRELTHLRRDRLGFISQSLNLLPMLTAAVVFLADSRIVEDMIAPSAERVLERMKAFGS